MNIFITFDYELYFGDKAGSVEKSIIEPTEQLVKIADKHGVKFVFFVDAGYLLKLEEYKRNSSLLEKDFKLLTAQLDELTAKNHELQLHIHPHWEDSYYENGSWVVDASRYRLHDFESNEIANIVSSFKKALERYSNNPIFTFRGGGWSIQPFDQLREALISNNVMVDSTVFKGGKSKSDYQYFNFTECPDKTEWKFEWDPLKEQIAGSFTELPIASIYVSPWFYWKLIVFKILKLKDSEEIGDGKPIYPPLGERLKKIIFPTYTPVSIDGYKASLLQKGYKKYQKRYDDQSNFIVIGHPKALTQYSLNKLDQFLGNLSEKDRVVTYTNMFIK